MGARKKELNFRKGMKRMKGQDLSLNLIGYILIGIIGILVLLVFLQGPLQLLLKNTFCYFYQNVLQQTSNFCSKPTDTIGYITISEDMPEKLARDIAAYSIACWSKRNPQITKDIVCYNLLLQNNSVKVSELLMTQVMEKEGGCQALQNSAIVLENGTSINYPGNCGTEDDIVWQVSGNVIDQQSIVIIKYDLSLGKIVIEA